jgi:hypothetical protein
MIEQKKSIKIHLVDTINETSKEKNEIITHQEIEEETKNNKFYLPVLNLNNGNFWPSQPLKNRKHWTDKVAYDTCIGNCCNIKGLKASCCKIDPNDLEHVLGPVSDQDIKKIIKYFEKMGMTITKHDVVIEYEEGKIIGQTFFNDHDVFKDPKTYPILRMQTHGLRFACKFLSVQTGKCTLHGLAKPKFCYDYICNFVKSNFLVRTPANPNTYKKIC